MNLFISFKSSLQSGYCRFKLQHLFKQILNILQELFGANTFFSIPGKKRNLFLSVINYVYITALINVILTFIKKMINLKLILSFSLS